MIVPGAGCIILHAQCPFHLPVTGKFQCQVIQQIISISIFLVRLCVLSLGPRLYPITSLKKPSSHFHFIRCDLVDSQKILPCEYLS